LSSISFYFSSWLLIPPLIKLPDYSDINLDEDCEDADCNKAYCSSSYSFCY